MECFAFGALVREVGLDFSQSHAIIRTVGFVLGVAALVIYQTVILVK